MNKPMPSHDNITPEMKAANHAICTLASAMRDCERCPFKPAQPKKPPKNPDYIMSSHVVAQAESKGVSMEHIALAIQHGRKTSVTGHGGQARFIHSGIAVIVDEDSRVAITVYLDRVITPLRPDQAARGERIERRF